MKLRNIILSIMMMLPLVSCGTEARVARQEAEAAKALKVAAAVENFDVTIVVDHIFPQRMKSRSTVDGYKLSIKDGKVNAYLPFFGESHFSVVYGADELGIKFEDCPVVIFEDTSRLSKGEHRWKFNAVSGHETVHVTVSVWDNGAAYITCFSTNRSTMAYSGNVVTD